MAVMNQIGGSIHRIEDPHKAGFVYLLIRLFLTQKLNLGIIRFQTPAYKLLHPVIYLGYVIRLSFYLHTASGFPILKQFPRLPKKCFQFLNINFCQFHP